LGKQEALPLQRRLRAPKVGAREVVDKLAAAEVEAARRCTRRQPVRRT